MKYKPPTEKFSFYIYRLCLKTSIIQIWNGSNSYHSKPECFKQLSCKAAVSENWYVAKLVWFKHVMTANIYHVHVECYEQFRSKAGIFQTVIMYSGYAWKLLRL